MEEINDDLSTLLEKENAEVEKLTKSLAKMINNQSEGDTKVSFGDIRDAFEESGIDKNDWGEYLDLIFDNDTDKKELVINNENSPKIWKELVSIFSLSDISDALGNAGASEVIEDIMVTNTELSPKRIEELKNTKLSELMTNPKEVAFAISFTVSKAVPEIALIPGEVARDVVRLAVDMPNYIYLLARYYITRDTVCKNEAKHIVDNNIILGIVAFAYDTLPTSIYLNTAFDGHQNKASALMNDIGKKISNPLDMTAQDIADIAKIIVTTGGAKTLIKKLSLKEVGKTIKIRDLDAKIKLQAIQSLKKGDVIVHMPLAGDNAYVTTKYIVIRNAGNKITLKSPKSVDEITINYSMESLTRRRTKQGRVVTFAQEIKDVIVH